MQPRLCAFMKNSNCTHPAVLRERSRSKSPSKGSHPAQTSELDSLKKTISVLHESMRERIHFQHTREKCFKAAYANLHNKLRHLIAIHIQLRADASMLHQVVMTQS